MDDGLNCERDVLGSTRQTNALSFYSLGNEVDKGRSRTASLIYKSIVIGNTDKGRTDKFSLFPFGDPFRLLFAPILCIILGLYSAGSRNFGRMS